MFLTSAFIGPYAILQTFHGVTKIQRTFRGTTCALDALLAKLQPLSLAALLVTLVLLFGV
jgi:ACR3 family arsenite efflux pump ArsB